jgi:hypothetical protein
MMGMVQEKYHALEHVYPSRAEIIAQFGYDPKQLQHLIRMSWMLGKYVLNSISYEDLLLLDNKITFRDWLMSVKRGREYNLEKAREQAKYWLDHAELAIAAAKEVYDGKENEETSAQMDEILGEMIRRAMRKELLGCEDIRLCM